MLMVQNGLRMMGEFEGILGLGQPKNETEIKRLQKEQEKKLAAQNIKMQHELAKMAKVAKTSTGGSASTGDLREASGNQGSGRQLEEELKAIDKIIKAAMTSGTGSSGMENAIATIVHQYPAGLQALATSFNS